MRIAIASILGAIAFALPSTGAALAAAPISATTPSDAVFVAQIVVLLMAGRALGELMQRVGQPAIIGQLLAGILVGTSVLGAVWPSAEARFFLATLRSAA